MKTIDGDIYAISESGLRQVQDAMIARSTGGEFVVAAKRSAERKSVGGDNTAVLYIRGIIEREQTWLGAMLGGTSCQDIKTAIDQAMNSNIDCLVLDFDSPGGSVYGIHELSDFIYKSRSKKTIVSYTGALCASAAYWLAASAGTVVAEESSEVGSIGVLCVHYDESESLKTMGVKPTIIRKPSKKCEGIGIEPLSDEAKDFMQSRVDEYYSLFTNDLARYRNVPVSTVTAKYGGGRLLGSRGALAAGMVDQVGNFRAGVSLAISKHATDRRTALHQRHRAELDLIKIR
jgi:signal peptide peptidase SppA